MSVNFNTYQYEDAYNPKLLGNWVIGPPPPCDKRPVWPGRYPRSECCRPSACQFIAYDNGHLYPCVQKDCCKSPWGDYPTCSWERPSVRVRRVLPRKPKKKPLTLEEIFPCQSEGQDQGQGQGGQVQGPTTCQCQGGQAQGPTTYQGQQGQQGQLGGQIPSQSQCLNYSSYSSFNNCL